MNDDKKTIGDWQHETYMLRSQVIDLNEQITEFTNLIQSLRDLYPAEMFNDFNTGFQSALDMAEQAILKKD